MTCWRSCKSEFPDLTISKIRFLEDARAWSSPSARRRATGSSPPADIARLRYVLAQQRDHYLPLRVIKEQLDAIDRGATPADATDSAPDRARATGRDQGQRADRRALPAGTGRAAPDSREELLNAAGLRREQLAELEQFGLVVGQARRPFDDDALAVGKIVADLARFGLEGRHLRAFRTAAEREVGLFSQVVGPMSRQRGGEAKARAEETVRELAALSVRLHAALVQIGLRDVVGCS